MAKSTLWICLLIICNCVVKGSFSTEKLLSELNLADYELADVCDDLAYGLKSGVLQGDFQDKIEADKSYGHLLRQTSKHLKVYSDVPSEVERNYTYLVKPGDGLLPEEDWNMLVAYHNKNQELETVVKVPCANNSEGCLFTKGEYHSILRSSKDVDFLKATWTSWQHVFDANSEKYVEILQSVKKAATLNEMEDVTSYWEYLNDFIGAYPKAKELWEEIRPLYLKLHGFVTKRLNNYYGINETDQIPIYLLGSNFGNDWSYVANIVLPHPQLHYDVETFLKYKNLHEIYVLAENLTKHTSLGQLGPGFWSYSKFNMSYCEPHIFTFCNQEYSEVYDCDERSWITYLNSHETAFKIALYNRDYTSLMRMNLRYSAVDEAVTTIGSLLAVENIHHHGIDTVFDKNEDSFKMTKLLLIALRVLPQLPYYLASDEWRLQELEMPTSDVASSWWKFRNEYQGVKSVTGAELDFLRDEYITSNKPYISKFFGIIVAFQLILYYQNMMPDPTENIAVAFGNDVTFQSMIRDRSTVDWPYLLTLHYGLDISASPLLEFFKPLERYLDEAPLDQVPLITTTTTTSSTTTAAPSTEKSEPVKSKKIVEQSDQPKNVSISVLDDKDVAPSNTFMYVGIGLLVFVSCLAIAAFVYRNLRRRRRQTNNRRFET